MNSSPFSPISSASSAPSAPSAPPVGSVGPMPYSPWGVPARLPRPFPPEERPLAKKPKALFPSLYARIFGIVVVVVTVAVLALTAVAPAFSNHTDSAVPAGWTKVYDDVPNGARDWSLKAGCTVTPRGLDVRGDRVEGGCLFGPSMQDDLLSQGFLLDVTLAPDSSMEGYQAPIVGLVGKSGAVLVLFDQAGEYAICINACERASELIADDLSSAWHTDGYTPNHFAIRYLPAGGDSTSTRLTIYMNGQEVRTVEGIGLSDAPRLILDAASAGPDDTFGEAVYTHMTLYSASPPAS
jgi:hypothetical protein